MSAFEGRVQWNLSPPRVRYEEAVLDVAAEKADPVASVGVLAEACGSRRTTAARLLARLEARKRIAQRDWLRAVLADVAQGTCSVLEHGYQTLLVRPHGLPAGELQMAGIGAGWAGLPRRRDRRAGNVRGVGWAAVPHLGGRS